MRYVRRSLVLVVAAAALSTLTACLGVDVNTRFNEDGSGTMAMKLRISQMFLQMGQEGGAPVPLTKEDLEAAYKGLEGVTVRSVTQENTEQDRIITSVVEFKSYSVFGGSKDLAGGGATLSDEGGMTVYRVMIGEPPKTTSSPRAAASQSPTQPPAEDVPSNAGAETAEQSAPTQDQAAADQAMQAMLKSLVAGYEVSYTVTAPKPIRAHSVGELSADGKTVHYSIAMSDYMDLKQPVMLEVKW